MALKSNRLENIQVLRAIAALMVCAFHLQYLFISPGDVKPFPNGEMGVQVFFIISGLIMYHTTRNGEGIPQKSAWSFAFNRIIRIVPLYLLVTFVYVADDISWQYLNENINRIVKTVFFIPQMTDSIGPKYGYPLLDVGWTLNYEMFFYFIFFVSLLFGRLAYRILLSMFLIIGVLIPFIFIGGFDPAYTSFKDYPISIFNMFCNPMVLLFSSGVVLGMLMDRLEWSKNMLVSGFVISTLLFIIHVIGILGLHVNIYTDLLFIFPWIFFAAMCDKSRVFVFQIRGLTTVGDASYSLYLWHPIVFAYLRLFAERLSLPYMDFPWISFIIGMIAAVFVAHISFTQIESRVTPWLKSKWIVK
ncbi:MAG: acyltransferase family protein [Bacteroidota bacterium]